MFFEKGASVQIWKKIALALLVMALATACSNNVVHGNGVSRIGCVTIDSDAPQSEMVRQTKHFETLRNLSLDGLVAEVEVKTDGDSGVIVESETTREATDRLKYASESKNDGTLRVGLSCVEGEVRLQSMPKLTITISSRADVRLKEFSGDMSLGSIDGTFSSENCGVGEVEASDVDSVSIRDGGTVDYSFDSVVNGLSADLSGAGSLSASSVTGTMKINSSGTGDATVDDGKLSFLELETSGTGDLAFDGQASQASLSTSGTGDITVASVGNLIRQESSGTGEISLG